MKVEEYELPGTELKLYKLDKRIKTIPGFRKNGKIINLDLNKYKGKKTDSKPICIIELIEHYKVKTKERSYFLNKKTLKEEFEERRKNEIS